MNSGNPILGLKLNSINEESEENLASPIVDSKFNLYHHSHAKQQTPDQTVKQDFRNSSSSSPYYVNKLKNSFQTNMSPSLLTKSRFNHKNLSYSNINKKEDYSTTGFQSQFESNIANNKRLLKHHLFTDKNRSLSETGIEKSSAKFKFDRPDRLNKLKQLQLDKPQQEQKKQSKQLKKQLNIKDIESPSIKSIRSHDYYFSAEELTDQLIDEELLKDAEENEGEEENEERLKTKRSSSNSSFMSARSSPKESNSEDDDNHNYDDIDDDEESIYDLRDQMEKPILESPLLMSTYSNYLTLYECENWWPKSETVNLLNSNYIPTMRQSTFDGFSSIGLIKKRKQTPNKKLNKQNKAINENSDEEYEPGSVYERIANDLDSMKKEGFHKTHKRQDSSERVMNLGRVEKQISKTIEIRNEKITVLIKINGDTEIKISPLCLDGLKRFIDALTPTLGNLNLKMFNFN